MMPELIDKSYDSQDELGVIDLAVMLVRRKKVFFSVFSLFVVLGVTFALVKSPKYQYVSLFQAASVGSEEYLENPAATVAALKSRWLPEIESNYLDSKGDKLPIEVTVTALENTGLLRLSSTSASDKRALIETIHRKLFEELEGAQADLQAAKRGKLEASIKAINDVLTSLKGSADGGGAMAAAIERKVELEGQLNALMPGKVLVIARQSAEPQGISSVVIIGFSILLGLIVAVAFSFLVEFISRVRERLHSDG